MHVCMYIVDVHIHMRIIYIYIHSDSDSECEWGHLLLAFVCRELNSESGSETFTVVFDLTGFTMANRYTYMHA